MIFPSRLNTSISFLARSLSLPMSVTADPHLPPRSFLSQHLCLAVFCASHDLPPAAAESGWRSGFLFRELQHGRRAQTRRASLGRFSVNQRRDRRVSYARSVVMFSEVVSGAHEAFGYYAELMPASPEGGGYGLCVARPHNYNSQQCSLILIQIQMLCCTVYIVGPRPTVPPSLFPPGRV